MKKVSKFIVILSMIIMLSACDNKNETLSENIKKLELTGNLVTYEAYFHNVLETTKDSDSIFKKDRKLFAEYTGTIKLGIDLSKVKIDVQGDTINVLIPKAKIIGEPNVDESDFKKEKFIESEDGFLIKNPITGDDISKAFDDAQSEMKKSAESDEQLLSTAQTRAKIIIEESINQFAGISSRDYTINWEFES